ncbi:MAG: 50S ribosomal protein L31 [Candidatus Dojkabacteria bacterium]|nr:50S ribosomal protein L31 [Candidatus Dojkabacteria bacterium]
MKKGIHPEWYKDAKIKVNGKTVMVVGSTVKEMNVEVWSGNHPFFTGQELIVDVDNRVNAFYKKLEKANPSYVKKNKIKAKQKKDKNNTSPANLTLKDMLAKFK